MSSLSATEYLPRDVAMFDAPVCLSAPTQCIEPLARLAASDAAVARALAARLVVTAESIAAFLPTPRQVHAVLGELSAQVQCATARSSTRARPPGPPSSEQSQRALERTLTRDILELRPTADLPAALNAFARYDAYFGTRRLESMDPESFLYQVMVTVGTVLADLPRCMLDSHEIVMLLRATAAGISGAPDAAEPHGTSSDVPCGYDDVTDEQVHDMATWRWKIGHHLFSQYAVMSFHLIEASMAAAGPQEKTEAIDRLCHTYRGATAAMWYAQSFPSGLYNQVVRPTMEDASPSGTGFSGADSLDFWFMKLRLRQMLASLESEEGPVDAWPEMLWQAVWKLYEVQQVDLEHHVLIAHKLVGSAPSLKQERLAHRYDRRIEFAELSGIDTLRGMVHERAEAKSRFLAG